VSARMNAPGRKSFALHPQHRSMSVVAPRRRLSPAVESRPSRSRTDPATSPTQRSTTSMRHHQNRRGSGRTFHAHDDAELVACGPITVTAAWEPAATNRRASARHW
jgi:hypothetical protein